MTALTLTRTGDAPLAFTGTLLREAGGRHFHGREQNRWWELAVYEIDASDSRVVRITCRTTWQGEADHDRAVVVASLGEVAGVLRDYRLPPRVGFPPGPQYADRQRQLETALRVQYDAAVTELLDAPEFAEGPQVVERERRDERDLSRYRRLLGEAVAGLPFSRNEVCLILDALNGTFYDEDFGLRLWPAEVEDHIRLNQADEKWAVDARDLLRKVHALSPLELTAVADAAERFWRAPERDADEALVSLGFSLG